MNKAVNLLGLLAIIGLIFTACSRKMLNLTAVPKPATEYTRQANAQVYALLDFNDKQEFEFAQRGLLAAPETLELFDENGNVIWSQKAFAFVEGKDSPDTANPSLWRHTQLNHLYGLFEVMDGIYQVRGYDLSNITFIRGDTGWIVFDPLSNVETSRAALKLINDTLGERPVTGVVISHSHVDHFGGIKGIINEEEIIDRNIDIFAPIGFDENAISENIYAGNAMARRADYMYGRNLEAGEKERLAVGLGIGTPLGTGSYIAPTKHIRSTGERYTIDGIAMVFQLTPGTEAPAEMNTWFPDKKALWAAENCTGTLHNLYTLRGAQVRDGNAWAGYIMEAVTLYGAEAEVIFQSHNWPHWGNGVINEYLINTAAMYKFINDQSLLYINQGYTPNEISNMIQLPDTLERVWYTRQYYGTLSHNAKAVYQRYIGWYDANPAHLNPLSPSDSAKKLVEYMGNANKVLENAKEDFNKGEYQWVAEITTALIFADPSNTQARLLCADSLEQLGYQAESGVWRAAYLSGAHELRNGVSGNNAVPSTRGGDMLRSMEPYMIFDYMGILMDSNAAQDLNMTINFNLIGDMQYLVTIKSGVLLYQKNAASSKANATITLPKQAIALLLTPNASESAYITITGDTTVLQKINSYMVQFNPYFNIIEP